jgi:hypothetical protein
MLAVAASFVSMAISGNLGLEVSEAPGGAEEEVAFMAISSEPGPEALRVKGLGDHGEWVSDWRRFLRNIVAGSRGGQNSQKFRGKKYHRTLFSIDSS